MDNNNIPNKTYDNKQIRRAMEKERQAEIERCQKYGEACSYGICDECEVNKGVQPDE